MVRDEQPGSAVFVRDGSVFKSELLLLLVVFEKLLKHLWLRVDQYSMPVIFGHELPQRIIGQRMVGPDLDKEEIRPLCRYFGEQEIQHVNGRFDGVLEFFDAITENFDAALDKRFQLSSEGHVALHTLTPTCFRPPIPQTTEVFGRSAINCKTKAEPMLPPAPATMTDLPSRSGRTSSLDRSRLLPSSFCT